MQKNRLKFVRYQCACKRFSGTDFLSENVLLSEYLGQVCEAMKRGFKVMFRDQWHQGWQFKFSF